MTNTLKLCAGIQVRVGARSGVEPCRPRGYPASEPGARREAAGGVRFQQAAEGRPAAQAGPGCGGPGRGRGRGVGDQELIDPWLMKLFCKHDSFQ